ncbi:MAG: hypothetical protein ACOYB2_10500 [Limnohabitans sp.]
MLQHAGAPTNGASEVQRVTGGGVISGGTWDLDLSPAGGKALTLIPWNVTAAALQALVDDDRIVVSGGPIATTPFTFTFGGSLGGLNLTQLTASAANLTGAGHALTPSTVSGGTQGTFRGAANGSYLEDTTNGVIYLNTGTTWVPDWTVPSPLERTLTVPTPTDYVDISRDPNLVRQ